MGPLGDCRSLPRARGLRCGHCRDANTDGRVARIELKELIEDLKEHDDESAKYRENQARNDERMNGIDGRMTRIENRQNGKPHG